MEGQFIVYYLCLGMFWAAWLEYFSTARQIGEPWDLEDRIRNVIFWPLILAVFLYYLFGGGSDD